MKALTAFFLMLFLTMFAYAQDAVVSVQEAVPEAPVFTIEQLIDLIVQSALSGKWVVAGAGIIFILLQFFKKYIVPKYGLGSGSTAWLGILLGPVMALLFSVVGGAPINDAIMTAFLSGIGAQGFWNNVVKLFLKKG